MLVGSGHNRENAEGGQTTALPVPKANAALVGSKTQRSLPVHPKRYCWSFDALPFLSLPTFDPHNSVRCGVTPSRQT